MIVDQLLLCRLAHTFQWIECTFEVTVESFASLNDLAHDLFSLCLGDTWTKRVASEVSTDSDSRGVDHCLLLGGEISILKSLSIHIGNVFVLWLVLVIVLNNHIEKLVELGVSIVGSGIHTDT